MVTFREVLTSLRLTGQIFHKPTPRSVNLRQHSPDFRTPFDRLHDPGERDQKPQGAAGTGRKEPSDDSGTDGVTAYRQPHPRLGYQAENFRAVGQIDKTGYIDN